MEFAASSVTFCTEFAGSRETLVVVVVVLARLNKQQQLVAMLVVNKQASQLA